MKISTFVKRSVLSLAVTTAVVFSAGSTAFAAQIPYDGDYDTLPSPTTPAFNIYTNVPNSVGNEADFVRLRVSNGNPIDAGTTGERNSLYKTTLDDACKVGTMYDVRTYIHNGADADNNENGNGSAVAKNVKLAMTGPFGTKAKQFVFGSTLTASNAATVTDNGTLNCGSDVQLEIVPTSLHIYTRSLGWRVADVKNINGTLSIGSKVFGDGNVWACWDERIQVVYTVKVNAVPETPKETPKELPKTGAGSTLAIFAGTSVLGAFLYRVRALRSEA